LALDGGAANGRRRGLHLTLSFLFPQASFRQRTATWTHLPSIATRSTSSQMILVQPSELETGVDSSTQPATSG
jgi:hypothetical protein